MKPEDLIRHFPRLYHMAEAGTWEPIRKHGLLSTSALLDLFEINGPRRAQIESAHRQESVTLTHPVHGTAVIRDQKPMRPRTLHKCLRGLQPVEWYGILNRRTFFWLTQERLSTLLNARAYRDRPHCVITVDTRRLIEKHEPRVTLCPINSGSTIYNPPSRGASSFYRISDYPFEERRRARGLNFSIAELAVDDAVPDLREMVISVVHQQQNRILERIWDGHF